MKHILTIIFASIVLVLSFVALTQNPTTETKAEKTKTELEFSELNVDKP